MFTIYIVCGLVCIYVVGENLSQSHDDGETMEWVCLHENENRKLHFVYVQNYDIRKFAILVMSISINFVFLSVCVFHPLSLSPYLPYFPVAKKYAARNNGKTLYAWTLFYVPFDLHELIKTIVQSKAIKLQSNTVTKSGCN